MKKYCIILLLALCFSAFAQQPKYRFKVLAISEISGRHLDYSKAAKIYLNKLALDSNFKIDYVQDTKQFNDAFLNKYQLIIQLDYAPYGWKPEEMNAFKHYITEGKGGWIGFHQASLIGDFDGHKMSPWYSEFLGNIVFKDYNEAFAKGMVKVERKKHPLMYGVPKKFEIEKEDWYTYNISPRPNVNVIASVQESSFRPKTTIKMGDHPVIWVNEKVKARNVYIFMGHSPALFNNEVYKTIFKNAIFWASVSAS